MTFGITGMAKKKTSKATKQNSKPVFASKPKSKKKPAAKKSKTKKTTLRKTAALKAKTSAKSVDTILKAFEKERVTQNTDLVTTRKKIELVTKKIGSLKAELLELQAKEGATEIAITTLDDRRDKEIGTMLSNLGINLENAATAAKKASAADLGTPLFPEDEANEKEDASENSKPATV